MYGKNHGNISGRQEPRSTALTGCVRSKMYRLLAEYLRICDARSVLVADCIQLPVGGVHMKHICRMDKEAVASGSDLDDSSPASSDKVRYHSLLDGPRGSISRHYHQHV